MSRGANQYQLVGGWFAAIGFVVAVAAIVLAMRWVGAI